MQRRCGQVEEIYQEMRIRQPRHPEIEIDCKTPMHTKGCREEEGLLSPKDAAPNRPRGAMASHPLCLKDFVAES